MSWKWPKACWRECHNRSANNLLHLELIHDSPFNPVDARLELKILVRNLCWKGIVVVCIILEHESGFEVLGLLCSLTQLVQ